MSTARAETHSNPIEARSAKATANVATKRNGMATIMTGVAIGGVVGLGIAAVDIASMSLTTFIATAVDVTAGMAIIGGLFGSNFVSDASE